MPRERRPRQHTREHIHHDGKRRPLRPTHRQHHTLQRLRRIIRSLPILVQRPVHRNLLTPSRCLVDLAPRRHTRRHIENKRPPPFDTRRSTRDRTNAHQLLSPAPDGKRWRGIRKDKTHHLSVERLLHDPRRHTEVVRVLDGYKADAKGAGHGDGGGHAGVRGDEAKAVVGVYLGYYGRDFGKSWGYFWVEDPLAYSSHIGGQAVDAVGVDATEVGEDEAMCDDGGIFQGNTVSG